jgi:P27 family predicted phage terminase small subunit
MTTKTSKPKTATKPAAPKSTAPKHLGAGARGMWDRLRKDYAIDDAAGLALLQAACESFERAQQARELIAKDGGPVMRDRFQQPKPHPAVAIERDARGQMISALRALRLEPGDFE